MLHHKLIATLGVVCCIASGCAGRYVRIGQKGMTCAEAHNNAMATVSRLGYTIGEVKKPVPGSPGVVTGERPEAVGGGKVLVQIFCTEMGAEIEAKSDSGGLADVNFAQEFEKTFSNVSTTRAPVRQAAATGADVLMTIENATGPQLGADVSAAGVVPVSVRISNQTKTTYKFSPADVVFNDSQGKKHTPLSASSAAAKLPAAAADTVRQKALGAREVKPGETVDGYLFLPFGTYTRARVSLTERDSGEEEGFAIDF